MADWNINTNYSASRAFHGEWGKGNKGGGSPSGGGCFTLIVTVLAVVGEVIFIVFNG